MTKSITVLRLLTKIPRGKVTTYGELAKAVKSSPRAIGQVMRSNPRPDIYPCYKVIRSDGSIGGFDGCTKGAKVRRKIQLLQRDGIKVEKNHIDLSRYLYTFS